MKKIICKASLFITFFVLGSLFFSSFAFAYIDPSAVTYIVQIVVGVLIVGGAAIALTFRKMKRAITKKKDDKQEDYTTLEAVEYDDEFDDMPKDEAKKDE